MGLREIWQAAKEAAKRMNNGRDVNLDKAVPGWAMGPRLDAWEKAADALEAARHTDREAAARADALSAQRAVQQTMAAYQSWLSANPVALREVSQSAREELIGTVVTLTATVMAESRRLGVVPVAPPPHDPPPHPPHDPPPDPPPDPEHDPDGPDDPEHPEHGHGHVPDGAGHGHRR